MPSFPRRRESCLIFKNFLKNNSLHKLNQDSRLRGNDGELTISCGGLGFAKVSGRLYLYNNAPSPKTIFRLPRLKRIRQPETRLAKRNLLPAIFGFKPELSSQFIRHGIAGTGAGAAGAGADNGVKSVDDIQLQIQLVFADGDGLD